MSTENLLESSNLQFSQEIREIWKAIIEEIASVCKKILEYKELESSWAEVVVDFEVIIQELHQCIDKHLPKVLPLLEKYSKTDSNNTWTDLLHIWYWFWNSLWGLLHCYKEQIHDIVDENTYEISFGKWFPKKWQKLSDSISRYIDRTRKL